MPVSATGQAQTPIAVVAAAGRGQRFAGDKQFACAQGRSLLEWSLRAVVRGGGCARALVAVPRDSDEPALDSDFVGCPIAFCDGGDSRAQSVLNALCALADEPPDTWVLVQDAVRPLTPAADVAKLVAEVGRRAGDGQIGGILAEQVVAAVKRVEDGELVANLDRRGLWLAQTPQMFRLRLLRSALERAVERQIAVADEAQAVSEAGGRVLVVAGSGINRKVTWASDMQWVEPGLLEGERS